MPFIPPVTKALMLLCVGLFCLFSLLPQLAPLQNALALWPLNTGLFNVWQPLTYGFLHGDPLHLFFNMLGLWMFGSELETVWGGKRYSQLLAASVLTAAVAQLVFTLVVGTAAPTVGISGGLFGLLLAYGLMFPDRIIMPLFPPIPMKAKIFVAIFGALELLLGITGSTGIAHFAHLGGMLGAWLMINYWRGGRRR
ncbi:rhomboid family intramembrane serine protease [Roseateles terrae]|uniref:Membrane associated rhomboid family serine protease n=1 Tax=Roseateles terrae TaxID=431060 RepID=A0ABR6GNX5_9BURK|nr:rhomboid family intramembrane serine protease [Roseateles terrae]MBB3193392.1 membrane associated rhomboid family serine protease [Roseateles terrae]OWQ89417.1 rhomboid family intramembrane serine protease [Roseateles terrae]